ncbi:hypothetical protein [Kaistia sp. MMO-174]|uniref:hypothetical protein n=1 Tax=Kaistia sp. MMO-174 TaxID=3081256 RepID=UPI003016F01C
MADEQTEKKAGQSKGKAKPKRPQDQIDLNDPTIPGAEAVARNLQDGNAAT